MTREILIALGWLLAAIALYAGFVALELYWNLYDWRPRYDARATAIGLALSALLTAVWYLARGNRGLTSRTFSGLACLALLILGIYLVPAEPLTAGVFARESSSPLWYRAFRLLALSAPMMFWFIAHRRRRLSPPR